MKVFKDGWQTSEEDLGFITRALDRSKHFSLIGDGTRFHKVDIEFKVP